jgi:phosphoglycerol transferase MdoB-like AlkP superfamily enzyme
MRCGITCTTFYSHITNQSNAEDETSLPFINTINGANGRFFFSSPLSFVFFLLLAFRFVFRFLGVAFFLLVDFFLLPLLFGDRDVVAAAEVVARAVIAAAAA